MSLNDLISNVHQSGSTQLIAKLLGSWIYKLFGGTAPSGDTQQTLISIFGGILSPITLWAFVLVTLYAGISILINMSQEGEYLKKEWNGVWAIIRFSAGLMAVIPYPGLNLVLGQTLVTGLALLSSSLADITWHNILVKAGNAGIMATQTFTPSISRLESDAYMRNTLNYSTCMGSQITYNNPVLKGITLENFDPTALIDNPTLKSMSDECGSGKLHTYLEAAHNLPLPQPPDLTPPPGSNIISNDTMAKFTAYQKQQVDYATAQTILAFLKGQVWSFYTRNKEIVTGDTVPSTLIKDWQKIEDDFYKELTKKLKSISDADKQMAVDVYAKQAQKYGWVSAGNYYRQLAQQQSVIGNAISASLQTAPDYVNLRNQADLTMSNDMANFQLTSMQNRVLSVANTASKGLDWLGIDMLKMGETSDPILAMTAFGQKLSGVAEAIATAGVALKIMSFFKVKAADKALSKIGDMGKTILWLTSALGLLLGTIIPCLPWVIFLLGVISWLIFVAEMFIVAPFWLVANAIPEGGTFSSHMARQGYNKVLFVMLYPILSLAGLVVALGISWVGMGLLNSLAFSEFMSLNGLLTIPMQFIGFTLVYAALAWIIIMNSFGLIQSLPRTLLNWLSVPTLGGHAFDDAHARSQGLASMGHRMGMGQLQRHLANTGRRNAEKSIANRSLKAED